MKALYKFFSAACIACSLLSSCESPDLGDGKLSQVNGLLNVTIKIPGNPAEFYATKKGPYAEGEEIIVKLPTTQDNPLDVSKLECILSLENNCYAVPAYGGIKDFTEPQTVTVVDALGNRHTNTISILPVPPKTSFTKVWEKTCTDLGLASRNNTGIAIYGKYLAIQEYNGAIYFYDMKTGEHIMNIDAARSFMMRARTDDGGHLITCRENIYGAGFMVFYYSETDKEHKLLLDYTAADGCPADLGYNMSVAGDVTTGTAYIYGMGPNDMNIYWWKLQDGQLITPANQPNKLRYGPAGGPWTTVPSIQRATLDDDSDHYISYNKWVNGNSDIDRKGHFNIFTSAMEVTALNPDSHEYRLVGFNVFSLDSDTFLAINDMSADQWAGGGATLKVFEITDRSKLELAPGADGYDDFLLFSGDSSAWIQNYFVWGDVAVYKEETSTGYDVYIASSIVGFDPGQSLVRMYKMSYFRQ